MKLFKISMAIGLCVGCFAAAYGQDTVEYQVTASEYEDLKNSPDKLAEIQSKGYLALASAFETQANLPYEDMHYGMLVADSDGELK